MNDWQPVDFKGDTYIAKGKYVMLRFDDGERLLPWGGVIEAVTPEKPTAWRYATPDELVAKWPLANPINSFRERLTAEQFADFTKHKFGIELADA